MAIKNDERRQQLLEDVRKYSKEYDGVLSSQYLERQVDYSVASAAFLTLDYNEWDEVLEEAGCMTLEAQSKIFKVVETALEEDLSLNQTESILEEKGYKIEEVEDLIESPLDEVLPQE